MRDAGMCVQTAKADLSEKEDRDDEDLCVICWEKAREVIFYSCMHMVRLKTPDMANISSIVLVFCLSAICRYAQSRSHCRTGCCASAFLIYPCIEICYGREHCGSV